MKAVKRRILTISGVAAFLLLAWGGYRGWQAHNDLVTLNVRNMDVRKVISKIEWQTWERIIVHNEVQGKITLNVTRVPMNAVLEIIGEQTESRWTTLYPLYTTGGSLVKLKKITRGDIPREGNGWTNLFARGGRGPGFGRGGGGPGGGLFGDVVRNQNDVVNLKVDNKDLGFATLALARFSQSQVVPEDGTDGMVNVRLSGVSMDKAVSAVAKQVNRKWDKLYTMQPDGRRGDFARDGRRGDDRDRERGRGFDTNRVEQRREQFEAERQRQTEAMLATMTPQEQQKFQEQRQQFEELRNLPPEQRAQRFQEMASRPEFQRQMEQRQFRGVLNTTPEQRAERNQRRLERLKERQARQGQSR